MKAIFEHDPNQISTLRDLPLIALENYRTDMQAAMLRAIGAGRDEAAGNNAAILFKIRREIERRELWAELAEAAEKLRPVAGRIDREGMLDDVNDAISRVVKAVVNGEAARDIARPFIDDCLEFAGDIERQIYAPRAA